MGINVDPTEIVTKFQDAAQTKRLREHAEKPVIGTHPTAAMSWSFYPTGVKPRSTKAELKYQMGVR